MAKFTPNPLLAERSSRPSNTMSAAWLIAPPALKLALPVALSWPLVEPRTRDPILAKMRSAFMPPDKLPTWFLPDKLTFFEPLTTRLVTAIPPSLLVVTPSGAIRRRVPTPGRLAGPETVIKPVALRASARPSVRVVAFRLASSAKSSVRAPPVAPPRTRVLPRVLFAAGRQLSGHRP